MGSPTGVQLAAKYLLLGWQDFGMAILVSASLIFTLGCEATKPAGRIARGREHLVRQEVIASPDWSSIQALAVVADSILVVLDPRSEPFLTAIAVRRPGDRFRFGRSGGGPGELRSPAWLETDGGSPSQLWVFEPNRRRMSGFNLAGTPRSAGTIQLHSERMLDDVKFVAGGNAVGIGLFRDRGVLLIADSTLADGVRYSGEVPYHTSQFPPVIIFDANRGSLAVSRARGRIAVAYMYFPAIDVFDSTGLFVTRWSSPTKVGFPRRPAGDPNPDFSVVASDLAFTRVAATDSGIFAVECSCPGASRDTAGSWIDSFSWDRGLLWRVHVPEFVTAVAVSRDGARLFLGVNDPEPRVITFLVAN
jgi:hypothetical protein